MENIYKDLEFKENFTILGDSNQALQYVLKKGESIITKSSNVSYESTDIETTPYILPKEKEKSTQKIYFTDSNLVKLQNTKTSFAYTGLSIGNGKIMKILPLLYNGIFVRYDDILAFSYRPKKRLNPEYFFFSDLPIGIMATNSSYVWYMDGCP